ncbi:hypothetical protein [Acidianus sp. HS-5]|uniref:hypothetical protein n=1 Tax=Acidianus sp. HS-5 TaxID=2886040 RepID=UPI001F1A2B9F|nr:hypothetical protein [Acidianus sp. HS-5]BDC18260.1 hypothetical protein HS5_11500 [Acidianus sp. HS-5]
MSDEDSIIQGILLMLVDFIIGYLMSIIRHIFMNYMINNFLSITNIFYNFSSTLQFIYITFDALIPILISAFAVIEIYRDIDSKLKILLFVAYIIIYILGQLFVFT